MKESNWAFGIVMFGMAIFGVLSLVHHITTTTEEDFYLGREVLSASMLDAIDQGALRQTGHLVMNKEKFVEIFLRRFAESVSGNSDKEYQIDFYDIRELPPKASVRVKTMSYDYELNNDSFSVTLDTLLSGVVETTYDVDVYFDAADGDYSN